MSSGFMQERRRAKRCSRALTLEDAVSIHRRSALGEAQHVIAAAYAVNQGRVSEILSGKRWPQAITEADRR